MSIYSGNSPESVKDIPDEPRSEKTVDQSSWHTETATKEAVLSSIVPCSSKELPHAYAKTYTVTCRMVPNCDPSLEHSAACGVVNKDIGDVL